MSQLVGKDQTELFYFCVHFIKFLIHVLPRDKKYKVLRMNIDNNVLIHIIIVGTWIDFDF